MSGGNESTFRLALEGDGSAVAAIFAAFKRQVRSDVADIQKATSNVKLFSTLEADLKKSAQSLDYTRASVATLTRAVEALRDSGEPVGRELAQSLTQAQRAAAAAEKDFIRQSQAVDKLRATLKTAGVDVNDLAAAEKKLAEAARQAAAAQVEQVAKTAAGFRSIRDVQPEINRVIAAYNALAQSGRLSFGELSTLQARATQQINTLRSSVTGLGAAFSEVRAGVIGFAAAFAGVAAFATQSAANFREFNTQIAAIGTIAGVTDAKLADLSNEVRRLAREMGVDAVNSARALYDIIGSGIPVDNAITVLAQATQAARAGLTDVHTAASVGVTILNGYGLQVDKLGHVYDVLFQTVKDGVITFPELAKNIGNVIPIARAANIPLEQIGAAFVVLTRQGIDAPEAATAISRAIQELAAPAPDAADKMRELGIQFDGLLGTVEQFSKKNLSLDQISKLIPEARASKAVLALAQNFDLLRESVESAARSTGSMQAAYERMAATPQAKVDRFNASLRDLSLSVGEFVTNASGFVETLTGVTNAFNGMGSNAKTTTLQVIALTGALAAAYALIRTLAVPINLLAGALAGLGTSGTLVLRGFTAVSAAITGLQAAVAGLLGYKVGQILYEWSGAVRILGDVLGASLAAFDNVARLVGGALQAAFTLNLQTLKETWAQFRTNAAIIGGDFWNAITGGAERTRALAQEQGALGEALNRTAKAAAEAAGEVDKAVTGIISKLDTQAKAVESALTQTQARLTSLVASLTKGVQDITQGARAALDTLAASVQTQIAGLSTFDVARVQETVAIQKKAATERLAILQQFAIDAAKAFESEATARREIARKSGEDIKRVDQEIAQARVATLASVVEAYRSHVNELLTLQRGHLEKVKEIEEQRRQLNQSVEEKIREIRRQGLTEYQQYNDKVREIDEITSKARQALARGDNKLAEELAQKAISLAGSVTTAVKDGEREVVSASSAQSTAISKITAAQDLLNKSLTQRAEAEKAGADAAAAGLKEALPLLAEYQKKLAEVTEQAKQGIKLRIEADSQAVTKAVDELAKQLAERTITLKLIADLKSADEAIKAAKAELEKGVPVPLIAKTEKLAEALNAVQEMKPELAVETTAAQAKVDELVAKARSLEGVKASIDATVTSNVDEVQAQIDKLKEPTSSTHTVYVEYVGGGGGGSGGGEAMGPPSPGMARGGMVRKFARGGRVFPFMGGGKVPGVGDGDTVPAGLRAGSYVVRKAASLFYGDGLMSVLAGVKRFATGGNVLAPGKNAGAVLLGGKTTGALSASGDGELRDALRKLYELQEAGRNLPKSSTGLDIGEWAGRMIIKMPLFDAKKREKALKVIEEGFEGWMEGIETARQFRVPAVMEFGIASLAFRRGGGGRGLGKGTDTVPAMLTPGEWVINRDAVSRYGANLMHAINSMTMPRAALAGMLSAPVPVSRFATGGPVGMSPASVTLPNGGGNTFVFNVDARDLIDENMIRRKFVPILNDIARRSQ